MMLLFHLVKNLTCRHVTETFAVNSNGQYNQSVLQYNRSCGGESEIVSMYLLVFIPVSLDYCHLFYKWETEAVNTGTCLNIHGINTNLPHTNFSQTFLIQQKLIHMSTFVQELRSFIEGIAAQGML